MPEISVYFIRTSLIYLVFGFTIGALMLINKAFPIDVRIWGLLPLHIQVVLFGWTIQLIFGVAYWIMPRLENKQYGKTELAWFSYLALNTGLLLTVITYVMKYFGVNIKFNYIYLISLVFTFTAILSFAIYIFPRVRQVIIVAKKT